MMAGQKLTIKGQGILGHGIKVFLDDLEITCCERLSLDLDAQDINHVTLEISPNDIDIDADTLASLVAFVDFRKKREGRA